MSYKPRLNDYVIWDDGQTKLEGWVYFVDSSYITIETKVKPKHPEDLENGTHHLNDRTLVLCFPEQWCKLEYVTHRENVYSEPIQNSDKLETYRDRDLH